MANDSNNQVNQQGSAVDNQTIRTGGDPSSNSGQTGLDKSADSSKGQPALRNEQNQIDRLSEQDDLPMSRR